MLIREISVSNFKSFENLRLNLGKLNVLIGSNASGKSNFIQIIKFLKDIGLHGLSDAIAMQGGAEYVRSFCLDTAAPLRFGVVLENPREMPEALFKKMGTAEVSLTPVETEYEFEIKFTRRRAGFEIEYDKLASTFEFRRIEENKKSFDLGKGKITFRVPTGSKHKLEVDVDVPPEAEFLVEDFKLWNADFRLPRGRLLLEQPILGSMPFLVISHPAFLLSKRVRFYNFDPRLPKQAVLIKGKEQLDEDGGNLPVILRRILESKHAKRKFDNLVKDLLPFIDDFSTEKWGGRYINFKVRENYNKSCMLPPFCLSDGTINLVALIVVLYFERVSLAVIEEPERNLHPHLISKLTQMFKDASRNKQIIITTHNPEMLRHLDLQHLYLVSRNERGFSSISKPMEIETLRFFLDNEIGVDRLFVDNLLGA